MSRSRGKMPISEMATSFADSLPTPTSGVYSRQGVAKSRRKRRISDLMRQSLEVPAIPAAMEAPLFRLGQAGLEHTILMLDREQAVCFRATCRSVRAATLTPGFANLWRLAHPEEQKAKAAIAGMRQSFAALDEETLEVEVAQDEGIRWERVLPKRKATRTTSADGSRSTTSHTSTAGEASSSTSPAPSAQTPSPVPETVGEARDISAVKSYFDSLDDFELEVDSPGEWAE